VSAPVRRACTALLGTVLALAPAGRLRAQGDGDGEQAIRARRALSNASIAKHDTLGFSAILTPDVVSVTSASAKNVGRALVVKSMADRYRDKPDIIYVRTPDAIAVFAPWGMASERGHWVGRWTDPDGKVEIGGTYFAKWRLIKGEWYVEGETYVPERCTGGAFCRTVP
jgi:hypothetical protein